RRHVGRKFKVTSVKEGYYPFWLILFKVEVQRYLFRSTTWIMPITVDGITGKAEMANLKVTSNGEVEGLEEVEVPVGQLLEPSVSYDEALKKARDLLNFFITTRAIPKRVDVSVAKAIVIYRPYWIAQLRSEGGCGRIAALDAITGEVVDVYDEKTVGVGGEALKGRGSSVQS
ncbi:MAG: hypothetical protein QXO76_12300, partial [Thermoproteota archaeon]